MRSSFVLLVAFWISESASLSPQVTQPQPEDPDWTSKSLRDNSMVEHQNLFSPRMDYDEWTPLGRGDPLKNDPTYDYVPPVLERVHYWMDPSKRTPDPPLPNSGVLILGSRTESAFTTQPTTLRYQAFQSKESQADSRIDTSSLLDPFFKLMDVPQFNMNFNSNSNYKPNRIQRPPHQSGKQRTQPPQALQRPPYTMLVPPPPPLPPMPQSINFMTTARTQTTAPIPPTSNPLPTTQNATTLTSTVLANTENVFKAVAISMPAHVGLKNETQNEVISIKPLKKPSPDVTKQPEIHTTQVKHRASPRPSNEANGMKKQTKGPPWYRENEHRATTALTDTVITTTARINTLTTDPMFKHYKQPSEPVRGPFYLIIQGHSKVKTYGASKNPVNSLLTSNEIKNDEEDEKKTKFERKTRRLRYDTVKKEGGNKLDSEVSVGVRGLEVYGDDNLGNLEETFAKSDGGRSKKRYLGSNHRRKRFLFTNRRLLSESTEDCQPEERNSTESADNLDLESLIAISDDYDPETVADILLKDEGSPGSGFGGLAVSLLSRAEETEDI